MRRFTRLAAVAAVAASFTAVAAAPAVAQTDLAGDPNPCLSDPGFPQCPQYVFDVADRANEYAQHLYDTQVQPKLTMVGCVVVETLTERTCD